MKHLCGTRIHTMRAIIFTLCSSSIISYIEGASVSCTTKNPTSDGELKFVQEEWTNSELVVLNRELELMCDAANFCGQVEWFKDQTGEPIDEELDYIHFEDYKQRLVLEQARHSDGIYYTCRASNGQDTISRTILVQVLAEGGDVLLPLPRNECQNATADLWGSVRFFCEYSIGTQESSKSLATYWSKQTPEGFTSVEWLSFIYPNDTAVYQEITYPNDGEERNGYWVYNTTLHVSDISEDALSEYRVQYQDDAGNMFNEYLSITLREDDKQPTDNTKGLPVLGIILCLLGIVTALCGVAVFNYRLELLLYRKDHFSKEGSDDNKESDAYISYCPESEEDINFVVRSLMVELEKSGYRIIVRDRDHLLGTHVADEIVKSLETSRRCILVISPEYITSSIGDYDINVMMDRMANYKREIIPIVYRDIADVHETDEKKLLTHIMGNVKCLTWPGHDRSEGQGTKNMTKKEKSFNKSLLLRMPPRHHRNKSPPILNTNPSQVELISYERLTSEVKPSALNEFSSVYPDPFTATSNNDGFSSLNSSDNPHTASNPDVATCGECTEAVSTGQVKMYPVLI